MHPCQSGHLKVNAYSSSTQVRSLDHEMDALFSHMMHHHSFLILGSISFYSMECFTVLYDGPFMAYVRFVRADWSQFVTADCLIFRNLQISF